MRFVDERGQILNIYQQLTQLADDHMLDIYYGGWQWGDQAKLSAEAALEVSQMLLRRSTSDYCAVVANFHPDLFYVHPSASDEVSRDRAARWLEGTLDYATAQSIPIWSALEWLRFTEMRHDADLEEVRWQPTGGRLSFHVSAQAVPTAELAVMVPLEHGDLQLTQVEVDGLAAKHRERRVGGVRYGWVAVGAGPHRVVATYG
jgi:hypothetical protein